VLNRTPAASLKLEFSRPVLAKVRDLQEAIEALRMFSAMQSRTARLAGSLANTPVASAQKDTDKQPCEPPSKPQTDQPVAVAKGQKKSDGVVAGGVQGKNLPSSRASSTEQPPPPGRTAGTAQALGMEEKSTPAPSVHPMAQDQLPQNSTRQIWYFIASMWGAVFTYVLAPLVLDALRLFLKNRRPRRKVVRTSLPAAQHGSYVLALPQPMPQKARQARLVRLESGDTDQKSATDPGS